MKNQLQIIILILVCLFSIQTLMSQNEWVHKIQPFYNPFILKAGNLSKQYTTLSNDFVNVEYMTPFIFESGINYVISNKKWSWSLGFSLMNEQHSMKHTYPDPYDLYHEFDSDYPFYRFVGKYKISSNFLGINTRTGYNLTERIRLNLGLNLYFSTTRQSRIDKYNYPNNIGKGGFHFFYFLETPDGQEFVATKTDIVRIGQKQKPIFLPELSFDYEISPNLFVNLGFRCQFWETSENYRFKFTESGYVHSTTPDEEELHSSRITAQGYYFWLGLKYDIPILSGEKLIE